MTPQGLISVTQVMHQYQFGVKEGLILGHLASMRICTRSIDFTGVVFYPLTQIRNTLQILKRKGFVELSTNYWGAEGYVLTKLGKEIFKNAEL